MKSLFYFIFFFWGGGGRWGRLGLIGGSQDECEQRIEVFVKIQKNNNRGGGGRCRVGGGQVGSGVGGVGGVRVDVSAMLGVGGEVGYEGCEPRIEGIVQRTKRYCTILRKLKRCGGGKGRGIFEPKTH